MDFTHIAICDDEAEQRAYLAQLLRAWFLQHPSLPQADVREYSSAEAFLFDYEEIKDWQLLILDIEMGKISGMDLAKRLREQGDPVAIVFVTGYDDYMGEGYDVEALHYLIKPFSEEKLFGVLERALLKEPEPRHIFDAEEGSISLAFSDIWYAEAFGHYCILYTKDRSYKLRCGISALEKQLEGTCFEKSHRSYLVNLRHVLSVKPGGIELDDGRHIPLSRNAYRRCQLAFIELFGEQK